MKLPVALLALSLTAAVPAPARAQAPAVPAPARAQAAAVPAQTPAPAAPETVAVVSGALHLRGLLWHPPGAGPFPAVLFNHGSGHATGVSASGLHDQRHPELLGPLFARHGYAFLFLFRRGDGLSAGQGTPSGDLMDRELAAHGQEGRNRIQIRLLETDELEDALAGLAYLRARPEVDPRRIAVVGHSFGGTLALLVAEHEESVRAAIAFSGSGFSWPQSPQLRTRLLQAVDRAAAPIFFIHAANDYSVAPGKELAAEMARRKRPYRLKIYPPIGHSQDDGHGFIYLGVPLWEREVFAFLDRYTRPE